MNDAIAHVRDERQEDADFIRAHMLLLRRSGMAIPLSTLLSGADAIRAHPHGALVSNLDTKISYDGPVEFEGLRCHRVIVEMVYASGKLSSRTELWLAEARNYIPARRVVYSAMASETIPKGFGSVTGWIEVEPGIWFPQEVDITDFDRFQIHDKGIQKVQWHMTCLVEDVSLNPEFDRDFFSNMEFPDGTAVYEVTDGNITNSWRAGAPESPTGPVAVQAFQKWWLLWVNLLAIVLVLLILIYRRRNTA